jgi:phosphatidylserine/phosphatidylglycerophosphate/cardiolipin synthase-like enzyme
MVWVNSVQVVATTLAAVSDAERWFLSAEERGNDASRIDRRHSDGKGWTEGNAVVPLVHGANYFARLHAELTSVGHGDQVWFLDWRGDAGQRLAGPGTEVGPMLAAAARRGVAVRALVWRSHPDEEGYSEQENKHVAQLVNDAGGEVVADERVRRFGSHHQKLVVIQRCDSGGEDVAFVGGIDLCHGRGDDERHGGDPQAIKLDPRYGSQPAWHDIQLEVRGPAVGDLGETFRERWLDPNPVEQSPLRAFFRRLTPRSQEAEAPGHGEPARAGSDSDGTSMTAARPDPAPVGNVAVQVLRTYPAKRPAFPFAPRGERSIARAYIKALENARSLIYIEDQYLWSKDVASLFADALRRSPDLRLIAVVPRYPDRDSTFSGPLNRVGQLEALTKLHDVAGDRVAVYDLERETGLPIYVHGKLCLIDDVWMAVGSDNLNRRSWTHDSEAACAVLDPERDRRNPVDPGGLGDEARVLPRNLRLSLWREHLGPDPSEAELLDPCTGFEAWLRSAQTLDAWHADGQKGPRPNGRARRHRPKPVPAWASWWTRPLYRLAVDPDGRPSALKRSHEF